MLTSRRESCFGKLTVELLESRTLLSAGYLDPLFGSNGKVITDINSGTEAAHAIAVQSDGKTVVAGSRSGPEDWVVSRYTTDGRPDPNFGITGAVTLDLGGGSEAAQGIAIQPDGKIVVAGYTGSGMSRNFAVIRLTTTGGLDAGFGDRGIVRTDFGSEDGALDVALQADGKVVVTGYTFTPSGAQDVAVARYNADGSLDSGFGSGGKVTTDYLGYNDNAYEVLIQPDGKIVVVGNGLTAAERGQDFGLIRYNTNGTLDNSFGANGKVMTDFGLGQSNEAHAVAIQPDGKIVVGGWATNGSGIWDWGLARYLPDGGLDTAFGTAGLVRTVFNGGFSEIDSIALQPDGKIVAAGYTSSGHFQNSEVALARYNADGTLDQGFGVGGKVRTDITGGHERAWALAIQQDGNIVAAGQAGSDLAVLRYLSSATPTTVLLHDDFNDNSRDAVKWFVANPHGNSSVTEQNQHVELRNRGHLVTVAEFDPRAVGPLLVTGMGNITNSQPPGYDYFQVLTRSDGVPGGVAGETNNGIQFVVGANDSMHIEARVNGVSTRLHEGVPIPIENNGPFTFEIRDDGTNLTFTVREIGSDRSTATITAVSPLRFAKNHVVFHNREFNNGSYNTLSYLDDVTIARHIENQPPTAVADDYTVQAGRTLVVAAAGVLANDTDSNNDPLTAAVAVGPAHGQLTLNANGSFTYVPHAGFDGTDTFTYRANDDSAVSDLVTVTLTVTPNAPPVAADDATTVVEDGTAVFDVLGNDTTGPDTDEALSLGEPSAPAHGVATRIGGQIRYTPNPNYAGPDSFTYTIADGHGGTATATVNVTVTPVSDGPVVAAALADVAVVEDAADVRIDLGAHFTDADLDALTFTVQANSAPGLVAATADGAQLRLQFQPQQSGRGLVVVRATDTGGAFVETFVTITVAPANDPPQALQAVVTVTATEDGADPVLDLTALFADPDRPAGDTLTFTISGNTDAALLTPGVAFQTLRVRLAPDRHGAASFTVTATDAAGLTAALAVQVTVGAVNDAPRARDFAVTTAEGRAVPLPVFAHVSDVDDNGLTLLDLAPAHGAITVVDGQPVYTPGPNFAGPDTFTYTVRDASGATASATVSVTVTAVNDGPTVRDAIDPVAVNEDAQDVRIDLAQHFADADLDTLTFAVQANAAPGLVAATVEGTQLRLQFQPEQNGGGLVVIRATDPSGAFVETFVTISVAAVDDPPRAFQSVVTFTVPEDGEAPILDLTALFTDPDLPPGGLSSFALSDNTDSTLIAPRFLFRTVQVQLAANRHGRASFVVSALGAGGQNADVTVNVIVQAVNDAPRARDFAVTTGEDQGVQLPVAAHVSDVDGDQPEVISFGSMNGSVALVNGRLVYTPAPNFSGTDTFTYTVGDGRGGTATAIITVTVSAANDAPVNTVPPKPLTVFRNGTLTLRNRVAVGDVDGSGELLVTLRSAQGTIRLTGPLGGAAVYGNGTGAVAVVGSLADLNRLLGIFDFRPRPGFAGPAKLTLSTNDMGNGGRGAQTDTDDIHITVGDRTPVRKAPNVLYAVRRGQTLAVSVGRGLGQLFRDPDGDALVVRLVPAGAKVSGLTLRPDGSFTYTPPRNVRGKVTFTVRAFQVGGTAGRSSDPLTVTIDVL